MDKLTKERINVAVECDRLLREGFEKYVKDYEWERNTLEEIENQIREYFESLIEEITYIRKWNKDDMSCCVDFGYKTKIVYVSYWMNYTGNVYGKYDREYMFEIPIEELADVVDSGRFEYLQKYQK